MPPNGRFWSGAWACPNRREERYPKAVITAAIPAIWAAAPFTKFCRSAPTCKSISKDLDLPAFQQIALKEGMRPLRYAAAEMVARGITTIREVIEVLPPSD